MLEQKLAEINNLHPNLKFTCENEVNGDIPFLDMKVTNNHGIIIYLVKKFATTTEEICR